MNFQNPIKSLIRSTANWAGVNTIHSTHADYLVNVMGNLNGAKITPGNALSYSPVLACVSKIASTVATLPFRVYENKNSHWAPFTSHPLNYLISTSPSEQEGKIDFIETLVASLLLWGNGYALIHKDHLMRTQSYEWIHPTTVIPFKDKNRKLFYAVKNQTTGKTDILTPDEIIHVKDISTDGIKGRSRVTLAAESLEVGVSSTSFGKNFFDNGANMSGVLETDKVLNDVNQEVLRNQFHDRYHGSGKAHKTLILEQGMKYNRIGIPPNDAQFLETRQFSKSDAAMIFGMPPAIIGILEKASYNSLEQQNLAFAEALRPWVKKLEEEFTRKSFRTNEQGKFKTKMNLTALLRADTKTRAEYYGKLFQMGVFSPDEIREMEGKSPRPDGKGDQYYVPMNLENTSNPTTDGKTE